MGYLRRALVAILHSIARLGVAAGEVESELTAQESEWDERDKTYT